MARIRNHHPKVNYAGRPPMMRAMTEAVARVYRRGREFVRWHVEKPALSLVVPVMRRPSNIRVIADMPVPMEHIPRGAICYCAGVGEDVRFELFLIDTFGANVCTFDPTPRAIRFMETANRRDLLRFVPVGLWNEDTTLRFYAPENPAHVSYSAVEGEGRAYFEAECCSLSALMTRLGHDHIDLLKMNIEGAEHVVLEDMLRKAIRPRVLITTYEGKRAMLKARQWTKQLARQGYELVARAGWSFTYLRS